MAKREFEKNTATTNIVQEKGKNPTEIKTAKKKENIEHVKIVK